MNIMRTRDGVATLPTIVAMAVLVLAVSIGVSLTSFSESFVSEGQSKTSKAYGYAEAGMRDAMRRISINKNATSSYTIAFVSGGCGSGFPGCATITISTSTGSVADPKIIISVGRVGNFSRQIQSNVVFDTARTGKIMSVTKQETAVSASVTVSQPPVELGPSPVTGFTATGLCLDIIRLSWTTPNEAGLSSFNITDTVTNGIGEQTITQISGAPAPIAGAIQTFDATVAPPWNGGDLMTNNHVFKLRILGVNGYYSSTSTASGDTLSSSCGI